MALVRYRTNDYSVPTAYGFQDVIVCGGTEIARHSRCYGEGTGKPVDMTAAGRACFQTRWWWCAPM